MKGKKGAEELCWRERLSSRGLVLVRVPAEIIDFDTRLAPRWLLWEVIVLVEEVVEQVVVVEMVVVEVAVMEIWSCLVLVTFTESPSRSVFVARLGPAQLSRDKS